MEEVKFQYSEKLEERLGKITQTTDGTAPTFTYTHFETENGHNLFYIQKDEQILLKDILELSSKIGNQPLHLLYMSDRQKLYTYRLQKEALSSL